MFGYSKFWTVGHTETFLIIIQKNRSNKITHTKSPERKTNKQTDKWFPWKFSTAKQFMKPWRCIFWELGLGEAI